MKHEAGDGENKWNRDREGDAEDNDGGDVVDPAEEEKEEGDGWRSKIEGKKEVMKLM